MRVQRLLFVYVFITTIVLAIAWLLTDGPWTQGETFIGIGLLLGMLTLGWQAK